MAEHIHGIGDDILPESLMRASLERDELVIRIPLDLLIWSQREREDSLSITDKGAMADWLVDNILEFGGDANIGSSAMEDLLDKCFIEALESAETWLLGWWELEDEDTEK